MERYIAMLRGINVSGQKIIKMTDLKAMFEALKFKNVTTYIQSGNVLFETRETEEATLNKKIELHLSKTLGYDVPVFLRTTDEIAAVIEAQPFKPAQIPVTNQPYVTFLHETPGKDAIKLLESFNGDTDLFKVTNREVYAVQYKDKGKPLFTNMFIEKKLKMPATGRNWLTVNKFMEL